MTATDSKAKAEWMPIDTAPQDGTPVVLAERDEETGKWSFWQDYWRKYMPGFHRTEGFGHCRMPTHWTHCPNHQPTAQAGRE